EKTDLWPAVRSDLAASKTLLQSKELSMNKRFVFGALATVLVLSIVVVFVANNVTTVSAKEILDRAYQVQTQAAAAQGIEHIRTEIYGNLEAQPEEQGLYTTTDNYLDLQSDKFRRVSTDNQTGGLID